MIDVSLFRHRAFSAALVVNFVAVLVMIGSMLFLAQYQMLVLGQSPFEAGLWSVPAAAGFVISSQLAPRLLGGVAPARVVSGGLAVTAVGLLVLTQVQVTTGLTALVASAVLVSLGMGPVFGLTTELVVGSAPAEKAGAASGISETAFELGGALGIAAMGSIAAAWYRSGVGTAVHGLPHPEAEAARDTLGGAAAVAADLPTPAGTALLDAARTAFVEGLQVTAAGAAVLALLLAAAALVALRTPAAEPAAAQPMPC